MEALLYKRLHNYYCWEDKNIIACSLPDRVFYRCFNDNGYNLFVVCDAFDKTIRLNPRNYRLLDAIPYKFVQRDVIFNEDDLDKNLRINPIIDRSENVPFYKYEMFQFLAGFLEHFADINNDFDYDNCKSYESVRYLKIYRKI
ncbi:unknown protein [Spodoptera frugiperda multiple nucleopolyhedrovirus]|uniref:Sf70 n=1 Tax=Spodoptera frugiperda nuclear polyhedrosis virus TaxID=10455 RepID=A1YJ60_NPVSF|nr:hypothetical protein SFMNPV_gp070 [Spodoptera frugiperda multiple nucleopolyhedrovirus]ABM45780.1 unknown protein [Spodoptera frugiperda multiple nucleopolyhedrovirus]ADV91303.1 hypothetical protein Sf70 [Spodoptera frugiperda multiple nucleopolyhedrovirus]AFH59014.1 hypothetical protein Sf70 [Spodoptera frugiperda multiple nucleopolyhedrovirus]AIW01481.1 hypothetical protein [Spodoptera frugiperda multiple nucleopolyhedrovirus]QED39983.1 hypothetical protein [Spodoptera frugiperda multiple